MNEKTKLENKERDEKLHARISQFPSVSTVIVGLWVLLFTILCGIALYLSFGSGFILKYKYITHIGTPWFFKESFIAIYAAGIGSSITTFLGYLDHASIKKDFDRAYIPWYFVRPVIGMTLGLIFYFILRGGLFVMELGTDESSMQPFNLWSIAAVSALVGLFSKNAVEKLRELFNTLFQTQDEMNADILDSLPDDLKKQVQPYLTTKKKAKNH